MHIRTTHNVIFRRLYTSRQLPILRKVKESVTIPGFFKALHVLYYSVKDCPVSLYKMHKTHARISVKVAVLTKSRLNQF
jgi:hypothetical protein